MRKLKGVTRYAVSCEKGRVVVSLTAPRVYGSPPTGFGWHGETTRVDLATFERVFGFCPVADAVYRLNLFCQQVQ